MLVDPNCDFHPVVQTFSRAIAFPGGKCVSRTEGGFCALPRVHLRAVTVRRICPLGAARQLLTKALCAL
jgi:hypothetical protein